MSQEKKSTLKADYRQDIDGLRAIAVLSVVIFHLLPNAIPGGFTGVDVFFVISGFLITGIIYKELIEERFSITRFYERRAKRILPNLFLVIISSMIAAYTFLMPGELLAFANSAFYAGIFTSNIFFWMNTGYFDGPSEALPLLHTWSLAVEEQFYIFWPLLMMLCIFLLKGRISRIAFMSSLAVASFISAQIYLQIDPKAAFYLLHNRAWELLCGAIAAVIIINYEIRISRLSASVISVIGLAFISLGFALISKESSFPGINALYPCIGAALLIIGGMTKNITSSTLSIKPFVFFGRISYSLYLWHWPIIVFYKTYSGADTLTLTEAFLLFAVSVAISYTTYRLIENPIRYANISKPKALAVSFFSIAAICAASYSFLFYEGFPSRIPEQAKAVSGKGIMWGWKCPFPSSDAGTENITSKEKCVIGAPWSSAKERGVLWGDSHAAHFMPLINSTGKDVGVSLAVLRGCAPFIDNKHVNRLMKEGPIGNEKCAKVRAKFLSWIMEHDDVKVIVIASAWAGYPKALYGENSAHRSAEIGAGLIESELERIIEKLSSKGKRVILLGDFPRPNKDYSACAVISASNVLRKPCPPNYLGLNSKETLKQHKLTNIVLERLAKKHSNVNAILPTDTLCDSNLCTTYVNNEFIYMDGNHIRRNLSEQTILHLVNMLNLRDAISDKTYKSKSDLTNIDMDRSIQF